MFDIIFPKRNGQRYWDIHYQYVLNIFSYLKCNITFEDRAGFVVTINGQDFLFDYADTHEVAKTDLRVFKFHNRSDSSRDVISFPSVSFYDWRQYELLSTTIKYSASSSIISCRQRPYGNATERRISVQNELRNRFGNIVAVELVSQVQYFNEVNDIFLAVFVPGYCNNMLDRGCLQYMGLGCPTISTNIPESLPFNKRLIDGVHYIKCDDNYSDLCSKLLFLQTCVDKQHLIDIGKNAKEMFQQTCTPERIGQWILQNL